MNKNFPQSKQDLCNQSEVENSMKLESAVLDIEGMCGGLFCDDYFIHFANLDAMAIACERYPRVLGWWEVTIRLGHPHAPVVWNAIKARMDTRAAARAVEAVCELSEA